MIHNLTQDIIFDGLTWEKANKLNPLSQKFAIAIDNVLKSQFTSPLFSLNDLKQDLQNSLPVCKIVKLDIKTKIDDDKNVIKLTGNVIYNKDLTNGFLKFIINFNNKTIKYFE